MPISIPKTDVEGRKYLVWTCLNMFRLLTGPFSPSHTHRESCHGWSIVHCCACLASRCSVAFSPTAIFGGTVAPWESSWRDPRLGVNQGTEPFSTSRTGLDFRGKRALPMFPMLITGFGETWALLFLFGFICIVHQYPWSMWHHVTQVTPSFPTSLGCSKAVPARDFRWPPMATCPWKTSVSALWSFTALASPCFPVTCRY